MVEVAGFNQEIAVCQVKLMRSNRSLPVEHGTPDARVRSIISEAVAVATQGFVVFFTRREKRRLVELGNNLGMVGSKSCAAGAVRLDQGPPGSPKKL